MKKELSIAFLCLSAVAFAENLLLNGDAENGLDNWNRKQVKTISENPQSGKGCFATVLSPAISEDPIPVDPAKKYRIAGFFRNADAKTPVLYLAVMPLDSEKKQILTRFVNIVPGTGTELAAPYKAGDSVLKVNDAAGWKIKDNANHIAFETDKSGGFGVLPNPKTAGPVTKVEQKGNIWEVSLDSAYDKDLPAGTPVRIQRDGKTYIYALVQKDFKSGEWKMLSAEIKPFSKPGAPAGSFWAGTKYVRIVVMPLGGNVCFDGLVFEEIK